MDKFWQKINACRGRSDINASSSHILAPWEVKYLSTCHGRQYWNLLSIQTSAKLRQISFNTNCSKLTVLNIICYMQLFCFQGLLANICLNMLMWCVMQFFKRPLILLVLNCIAINGAVLWSLQTSCSIVLCSSCSLKWENFDWMSVITGHDKATSLDERSPSTNVQEAS